MATSAVDAHRIGFQKAIEALFDDALVPALERRQKRKERQSLERASDQSTLAPYRTVREKLDEADDSFEMTRTTAQFYLHLSPTAFKQALARGDHPFAPPNGGAPKGEVDAWFKAVVLRKHQDVLEDLDPHRVVTVSRDMDSGRPYLVHQSGAILADGQVTSIAPKDVETAFRLGAGIRIFSLTQAMGERWEDAFERQVWAQGRMRVIDQDLADATAAVERAAAALKQVPEEAEDGPAHVALQEAEDGLALAVEAFGRARAQDRVLELEAIWAPAKKGTRNPF